MQSIQNCLPLCSKNFQLTRKLISWLPKGLCSSNVDVHKAKWIDQFDRMYKTLNEEANRLVGN